MARIAKTKSTGPAPRILTPKAVTPKRVSKLKTTANKTARSPRSPRTPKAPVKPKKLFFQFDHCNRLYQGMYSYAEFMQNCIPFLRLKYTFLPPDMLRERAKKMWDDKMKEEMANETPIQRKVRLATEMKKPRSLPGVHKAASYVQPVLQLTANGDISSNSEPVTSNYPELQNDSMLDEPMTEHELFGVPQGELAHSQVLVCKPILLGQCTDTESASRVNKVFDTKVKNNTPSSLTTTIEKVPSGSEEEVTSSSDSAEKDNGPDLAYLGSAEEEEDETSEQTSSVATEEDKQEPEESSDDAGEPDEETKKPQTYSLVCKPIFLGRCTDTVPRANKVINANLPDETSESDDQQQQ